jgi:hypothetical protein
MPDLNYTAIAVAVVAAFVASSVWYIVFAEQRAALSDAPNAAVGARPRPGAMILELARTLVLAAVLAGLAANLDVEHWTGALQLALATWIGFPIILLSGSVVWENVPWRLAAIHAGDWLIKILIIVFTVGLWR